MQLLGVDIQIMQDYDAYGKGYGRDLGTVCASFEVRLRRSLKASCTWSK